MEITAELRERALGRREAAKMAQEQRERERGMHNSLSCYLEVLETLIFL